jgi:hypothetical protein
VPSALLATPATLDANRSTISAAANGQPRGPSCAPSRVTVAAITPRLGKAQETAVPMVERRYNETHGQIPASADDDQGCGGRLTARPGSRSLRTQARWSSPRSSHNPILGQLSRARDGPLGHSVDVGPPRPVQ